MKLVKISKLTKTIDKIKRRLKRKKKLGKADMERLIAIRREEIELLKAKKKEERNQKILQRVFNPAPPPPMDKSALQSALDNGKDVPEMYDPFML